MTLSDTSTDADFKTHAIRCAWAECARECDGLHDYAVIDAAREVFNARLAALEAT